jgi:predicted dehydrogenase
VSLKKTIPASGKEIRIGMLGYGFMGKCHSHAFKSIPYIYADAGIQPRLLIMCGRNEDRVQREAARYGFEEYCTDFRELVDDPRIDIFDNCGPDPVHPEPCIAALANGKHVICEKPLAVSLEDARRMRDAAKTARGRSICVFNYRFFPAVRFAHDLISQGRLGTIHRMSVSYLQMGGHDPSLRADQVWYSSWPHSGVLQGIGSHAIDQCRYLVGEIASVSSLVKSFHPERAIPTDGGAGAKSDEATAAVIEFQNGAVGTLEACAVATGRKNRLSWEINGSKGSVAWDLERPNALNVCLEDGVAPAQLGYAEISVTDGEHPYASRWWPQGHNLGWEHAHTIEKYHFLEAVVNNSPLSPHLATFEDGYRVAVIVDAMRRSSQSGQRVDVISASGSGRK